MNDKLQAYIGDPPKETGNIADAVDVDYFAKALETRLKYCPDQNVEIIISAESARRIVDALKKSNGMAGRTVERTVGKIEREIT